MTQKFKIFYVNYVKFHLVLVALENGQLRPKHISNTIDSNFTLI